MSELVRVSEILVCFNPEDTSLAQLSPYKLPVAAYPPTTCAHSAARPRPTPSHFHIPTGGASAHAATRDAPARLACDEARTARIGGGAARIWKV